MADETRHPNSARFHEILTELGALHDRKQSDYGKGDDPFANVRNSQQWSVAPWIGAMVRLDDKVTRLQKVAAGGTLSNEGVEDSLRDIAVYAVIALVLFEQAETAKVREKVALGLPLQMRVEYDHGFMPSWGRPEFCSVCLKPHTTAVGGAR